MTEIDIIQEVLEEDGYKFSDEYSRAFSDTNILKFYKGLLKAQVYFNFKTGEVTSFYIDMDNNFITEEKKEIEKKYKIRLRDHKIGSILNQSK